MVKTAPIPCTKEEMDSLIEASKKNYFYYLLFRIAKSTGRRLGEYYNVRVDNFKFEPGDQEGILTIPVLKLRGSKRQLSAYINQELSLELYHYIKSEKLSRENYIFRKVTYRQIQEAVSRYAKRAGITHKVSFHNFRHFFVTHLVKKGLNYEQISKMTGHAKPSTLVCYDSSVASDVKDKALEALKDI